MKVKAAMAAIAGVFFGLFLSVTAFGATYDLPWTNEMNQESYWETYFATPGRTVECTKYENHGGYIGAEYDAAVTKKGSEVVRVYDDLTTTGGFQATHPQGEPPMSWVMKCKFTTIVVPPPPPPPPPPPSTDETTTTTIVETGEPPTTPATTFPPESPPQTPPPYVPAPPINEPATVTPSAPPEATTTVPPVLGTPPPRSLPETGNETVLAILAGVILAIGIGFYASARRGRKA